MHAHRERFTVHTYEADAFGQLSVPALAGFLAEAAGRHAQELGVGLDTLRARGLTWVLARTRLEIPRAPRLDDELEVETYPSGIDRLAALRDFRVRGADGAVRVRATSQWYVLDLATRRPQPPQAVLDPARFSLDVPRVTTFTDGKLHPLDRWEREKRFHVRYADIDLNLHVNNGSYVAWAVEGMAREVWQAQRVAELEIQYRAECMLDSAILSRVQPAGEGVYHHAIVREEDGKELARLTSRWVQRDA